MLKYLQFSILKKRDKIFDGDTKKKNAMLLASQFSAGLSILRYHAIILINLSIEITSGKFN